jgi:polyphosphate kinase
MSETILVRSILGRYLEHSRVFRFANGAGPGRPLHLIGSADLMGRNLDRRVEVLVPVTAPENQRRIDEVLDELLAPDAIAWMLDAEGVWTRRGHTDVPGDGTAGQVGDRLVDVQRRTAARLTDARRR